MVGDCRTGAVHPVARVGRAMIGLAILVFAVIALLVWLDLREKSPTAGLAEGHIIYEDGQSSETLISHRHALAGSTGYCIDGALIHRRPMACGNSAPDVHRRFDR